MAGGKITASINSPSHSCETMFINCPYLGLVKTFSPHCLTVLQLLVSLLDHRLANEGYSSFYNCTERVEGVYVCVCLCTWGCVGSPFFFSSSPLNPTLTMCGTSGCPSVTPAVFLLLTPSMREAMAHGRQPSVIQRAHKLSAILKKGFTLKVENEEEIF